MHPKGEILNENFIFNLMYLILKQIHLKKINFDVLGSISSKTKTQPENII